MATRREKDEARKAKAKGAAPVAEPEEASKASLAVRQGSDLSKGDADADADADEGDEAGDEADASDTASDTPEASDEAGEAGDESQAARTGEEGEGDDQEVSIARQLGADRYVMAGFFAAAILGAFVLGKAIHGVWADFSNRDWFNRALPAIAAVPDEDKSTYGTVLAALIAIVVTMRTYRRPDVREWTDEVASELIKVKWPTKKDVTNSTVVVIAASAVATLYLALLDRLWSFVTSIVYGTGS